MSVEICVFSPFFIRFSVLARKTMWGIGTFFYRYVAPRGAKERKMADMLVVEVVFFWKKSFIFGYFSHDFTICSRKRPLVAKIFKHLLQV